MKQILCSAALLLTLACTSSVRAQLLSGDLRSSDSTLPKVEIGVKAGANVQSISGNTWDNSYNTGIIGGFWARMHKNRIGVQLEMTVNTFKLNSGSTDSGGSKHYYISDSVGDRASFRATYLNIPLLLQVNIVKALLVEAGVQYSNMLSLSDIANINGDYKNLFTQAEFSGLVGVQVTLPAKLALDVRYRFGLTDVNNKAVSQIAESWKTGGFQVTLSYKIK